MEDRPSFESAPPSGRPQAKPLLLTNNLQLRMNARKSEALLEWKRNVYYE
jgi:hypothetical protein